MDTARIERLEARYHLPASRALAGGRLDRLLRESLDEALALALERVGITEQDELCLRYVHVPVRLRLSETDASLVNAWSEAFADHIRELLDSAHGDVVVHYRSRSQALVDFASSVALGDYRRAWAWRQIGIAALEGPFDSDALVELVHCLSLERVYIVPVLKALGAARLLHRIAGRMSVGQWEALARNALIGRGVDDRSVLDEGTVVRARTRGGFVSLPDSAPSRSLIARAIADHPGAFPMDQVSRLMYAVLVGLETEPMMVLGEASEVARNLVSLADALGDAPVCPDPKRPGTAGPAERAESAAASSDGTGGGRDRRPALGGEPGDTLVDEAHHDRASRSARTQGRNGSHTFSSGSALTPARPPVVSSTPAPMPGCPDGHEEQGWSDDARQNDDPDDARSQGSSAFGGLLLLLPLVWRLQIPASIARHPLLTERSMRGVLHRLALALVSTDGRDPAVLAFCGLPPDAQTSWRDEPPWTALETALIARWRKGIADHLLDLLGRRGGSRGRILDEVCRRPARLVADPGWFEVWFALDDVRTDFRRIGLDLDPGYLPWLGVVIKFFYE